jgi:adenine-specific DNA-methyltransferase
MTKTYRFGSPRTLTTARRLRRDMTTTERIIWSRLRDHRLDGLKFRRQAPIGPYIVDFVCASQRLVVEIDGSEHNERVEYDAQRTFYLQGLGYRVLRVTNRDVLTNLDGVMQGIHAAAIATSPTAVGEVAAERGEADGEGLMPSKPMILQERRPSSGLRPPSPAAAGEEELG